MKRYIKELDINLVSPLEEKSKRDNKGCLLAVIALPVIFILCLLVIPLLLNWIFGVKDPCKADLQACYCNSLSIASSQEDKDKLLKEIKERGYYCEGAFENESKNT